METDDYFYVYLKVNGDSIKQKRAFKNDVYACTYAARLAFINKTECDVINSNNDLIFTCKGK